MVNKAMGEEILGHVKAALGDGYRIELASMLKENVGELSGISIGEYTVNYNMVVYLDDIAKGCGGPKEIAEKVVSAFKKNSVKGDVSIPFEVYRWDEAKKYLYPMVLDGERNAEIIETFVSSSFLDLGVCYYLGWEKGNEKSKIKVTYKLMDFWGISEEELHLTAVANLRQHYDCLKNHSGVPMYVLTNQEKFYGAAAILLEDKIYELAEMLGSDLYIFPSSIHEIIAFPTNAGLESEGFLDMVKTINESVLSEKEVLCDAVYLFQRDSGKVSILAKYKEGVQVEV